jgi:hypothetical protein
MRVVNTAVATSLDTFSMFTADRRVRKFIRNSSYSTALRRCINLRLCSIECNVMAAKYSLKEIGKDAVVTCLKY